MITHKPTPEQLERLQAAHLGSTQTDTAVAEARAKLAQAIAEHGQALATLNRAIADVLYGSHDDLPTYSAEHGPELQTDL